jgi:preprotein translocase subunit SecE
MIDPRAIRRIRRRELLGSVALVAAILIGFVAFCALLWWSFDL